MVQNFNKLVRDNIPDKILNNGEEVFMRILSDEEFVIELKKKLLEEYEEVIKSSSKEERLEELADMLEVMKSLAKTDGYTLSDIIDTMNKKNVKRGGFDNKIFLEKTRGK